MLRLVEFAVVDDSVEASTKSRLDCSNVALQAADYCTTHHGADGFQWFLSDEGGKGGSLRPGVPWLHYGYLAGSPFVDSLVEIF